MRKASLILMLSAVLATYSIFADGHMHSKSCAVIAKACMKAGYVRRETSNKRFWQNCMKPIILGRTVPGVTVNTSTVRACRADKIHQLKKELREFRNAS